jgi:hypothetical protein
VTHIEVNMGVVVGGRRAHALELLDADPDTVDAFVVHEMRHKGLGHGVVAVSPSGLAASIVRVAAER